MLDARTHARTHGHSGDFILCPMLCIALDRQLDKNLPVQKKKITFYRCLVFTTVSNGYQQLFSEATIGNSWLTQAEKSDENNMPDFFKKI